MCRSTAGARAATRLVGAACAALLLVLWASPSAFAHTELESSEPADGAVSDGAPEEVLLRFTLPVSVLGEGIVVDGPSGTVPVDVMPAEDGAVLVAKPSEPLPDGDFTVSWTVAAQDGHPLEGTFSFTVAGGEPASPPTGPGEADDGEAGTGGSGRNHGSDQDPEQGSERETRHDMDRDQSAIAGPASNAAEVVARLGGAAALWGGLVAAGGLAFAGLVLRGRDDQDLPVVLRVVRWSGALVLGGIVLRVMARSVLVAHGDLAAAVSPSAISGSLTSTTLWEVGLQAAGGIALLTGIGRTLRGSGLAVLGALLVGAGQVFGGHSNTVEPRWLVVTADVAHLGAAATWVGGVVVLGIVLRVRRKAGRDLDAAVMGARFSVLAAVSVAVVGLAGIMLTAAVLDRPAQLWETRWGVLLLAKVAVVAVVGAIGAYNHFRVVPRLTARRGTVVRHAGRSRRAGGMLARSTTRETWLMVVIVLITAWLVTASTQE
ncbi:hypothetical protein GCM10028784_34220 [Myceligenerans cantabricum]